MASTVTELNKLISDVKARTFGPDVRAVAVWVGESGSTYVWPSALADNRPARTLARIARYGIEAPVPGGFSVVRVG